MTFKGLLSATAAVALMAAPTMAAAQQQPAVSVAPAAEQVSGDSALRGGFVVPAIALIAIILGILAATSGNDDDLPTSP